MKRFFNIIIIIITFFLHCSSHSYTGGNHKGIIAIVLAIVTVLILWFIHKVPCGLKGVYPQLGKQEALIIMGQSLGK